MILGHMGGSGGFHNKFIYIYICGIGGLMVIGYSMVIEHPYNLI